MSKNELRELFEGQYINMVAHANTEEDSEKMLDIMDSIINNYTNFERPDAYCIVHNKLFGIEHFKVSPFIQEKGGDIVQKEMVKMNKDLNEINIPGNYSRSKQCGKKTISDFVKAFKTIYNNHLASLQVYKKNIGDVKQKIEVDNNVELESNTPIVFIVQCCNTEITYLNELNKRAEVNPFYIDEIYKHVMNNKVKPDYMIFVFEGSIGHPVTCHITSTTSVSKPNELYNIDDKRLIFISLGNIIQYKIIISEDEIRQAILNDIDNFYKRTLGKKYIHNRVYEAKDNNVVIEVSMDLTSEDVLKIQKYEQDITRTKTTIDRVRLGDNNVFSMLVEKDLWDTESMTLIKMFVDNLKLYLQDVGIL